MVAAPRPSSDSPQSAARPGLDEIRDRVGESTSATLRMPEHVREHRLVQPQSAPVLDRKALGRVHLVREEPDRLLVRGPGAAKLDPVAVGDSSFNPRYEA